MKVVAKSPPQPKVTKKPKRKSPKKGSQMPEKPDLDDLLAQGMPLWRALEVWVTNRPGDVQEHPQCDGAEPLSGLIEKPRTRRH